SSAPSAKALSPAKGRRPPRNSLRRASSQNLLEIVLAYSGTNVLVWVMPRVKEFDEAEVLDQALELFRARGFKHTSFSDLVDELGVSRQSLYDTYGDKQTLYQTALKR